MEGKDRAATEPECQILRSAGWAAASRQRTSAASDALQHRMKLLFASAVVSMTLLSLWPLWANRFLPMQDYPQHLFISHLIATYHDAAYNWQDFYSAGLAVRPYMLWYLAVAALTLFCSADVAGKILFSLYILLIAFLVLQSLRLAKPGQWPWGALLLYPFAFNQMYYMGFPNFLLSLPLIFLAVLDLDRLECATWTGPLRHGCYCLAIYLNHPYGVAVYVALAAISTFAAPDSRRRWLPRLIPAALMFLATAIWVACQHTVSSAPLSTPWALSWWPLEATVSYYFLPFTGMRLSNGIDFVALAAWGVLAALWIAAWPRGSGADDTTRRLLAMYAASCAGFIVLPFWIGYYSYFNLRLAPISYFALALVLSRVPLRPRQAMVLVVTIAALLLDSALVQQTLVRETETVAPVLSQMNKNALVLPLVFDAAPEAIDPELFYQFHGHDADYYHIVKGGASPDLFPNAMMPVQYRPGVQLPCPRNVQSFSWQRHGAYYDYLLARNAPPAFRAKLPQSCRLIASSGCWQLFQNAMPRKPLPLSKPAAIR